jgi:hypothetical protein
MRLRTPGLLIFLSVLLVFALSLNGVWAADHPTSLMELAWALWAHHSIVLAKVGESLPQTVDVFAYKGNYYSALAPGVSFLALPFVGAGFALSGGFSLYGAPMLASELFVSLCNAIAAYLLFKLGSMYFTRRTAAFISFAYAFSTISWPFAVYFFESDVSAMLDLLAVWLALRISRSGSVRTGVAAICGTSLAIALTVDYVNAILVPVVSIFLVLRFRKKLETVKCLAGLLVPAVLGVLAIALYDATAFGNPLVTTEQAYLHTASILGDFSYPVLSGLYLDLVSPLRGIMVYCPVLILGVVGFFLMGRRSGVKGEGLLLFACFLGILLPYSMWYDAVGGEGFGQRFLIPAIPFLLLPSGFLIEGRRRGVAAVAYALYVVGVIINGIAGVTTTIPQAGSVSQFPFLTEVIPLFLRGGLDAWWVREAGAFWWAPTAAIVSFALIVPLAFNPFRAKHDGSPSDRKRGT